jgi:hypothetical protein
MAQTDPPDSILATVRGQLISPHYLANQLVNRADWPSLESDPRPAQIEALFEKVKPQLAKNKPESKGSNEDAVRDHLLNPVFKILGLPWSPSVQYFAKELDYALYHDEESFEKGQRLVTEGKELDALRLSCGIVEAERWGKEFGPKPKKSDLSDPVFQIEFYLQNARRSGGPRWGILTNGHTWRLYCGDSDPLRHDFLEIELPTAPSLFANQQRDAFKFLVYFFSVEALRRGGRLDKIYEEATRHAAAITAVLRRQAFGAVELIASAIMRASPKTAPSLAYEAALIQLFRLLFILKAEADGLLVQRELSEEIADRIIRKNGDSIGGGEWDGTGLWHQLHDIFEAIAQEYNGHLFQGKPPTSSPAADEATDYFAPARALLESVRVPNQAIANAIDRLLRVYQENDKFHPVSVDYSTLRVRELGTIYEGLLEWRLEPVSAADLKAGSIKLLGDKRIARKVEPGDFALVADQADRKATGSYYTPHYVVEFIVKNVLKPLLKEIEDECHGDPRQIISRVLDQRILDPAMGSGHFLVFAVERLADYVFEQLGKIRAQQKPNGKSKKKAEKEELPLPLDAPIEFIRARIAERCVYGVDINPLAVELAKLSLWVATAAKGVPLSFLNHHLRCGDSLLGVFSDEFHHDLFAQKLVQQMSLAVGFIRYINDNYSKTLKDIGKKEENLRVAREHLRRFRLTYDCQLASVFGQDIDVVFHEWIDRIAEPIPAVLPEWLQRVEKPASEHRFFHWELEFPEVWHDRFGRPLDATGKSEGTLPGFDVVLGNPPFVTAKDEKARHAYMKRWTTAVKGFHLLVPFFERAFQILRPHGRLGFIVSNAFAKREFGEKLVREFLPQFAIKEIVDSSGLLFPGHGTPTCIVFASNQPPDPESPIRLTVTLPGGGDLHTPPDESPLWHSIGERHSDACTGSGPPPLSPAQAGQGFRKVYDDSRIAVGDCSRVQVLRHPMRWVFPEWPVAALIEKAAASKLSAYLSRPVGFNFMTHQDEVFKQPLHLIRRIGVAWPQLRRCFPGTVVRDWSFVGEEWILAPYSEEWVLSEEADLPIFNFLRTFKKALEGRAVFEGGTYSTAGRPWYEYHQIDVAKSSSPLIIVCPEIATHTHFLVADNHPAWPQTVQVLMLRNSNDTLAHHLAAGLLNTSPVLFWLKQVCFNKGAGEDEERDRFVYAGNKIEDIPVASSLGEALQGKDTSSGQHLVVLSESCWRRGSQLPSLASPKLFEEAGEAYDGWNRALPSYTPPHPLIAQPFDTAQELLALKAKAKEERERLRREMIALQEEMDWLVYAAYGLLPQDHPAVALGAVDAVHPCEVALGQRPFELAALHAGPPADWGEKRKQLWQARIEAIRTNEHIGRIEQPVYKRRWVPPDYEKEFAGASKWWLREKAEFYLEHGAGGGPVSLEEWAAALWKDPRIRAAAEAYHGSPLATSKKFEAILKEAVEEETVPDDETAFKPCHRQLRGKLNVPRERFRSVTSKPGYYIWAGK